MASIYVRVTTAESTIESQVVCPDTVSPAELSAMQRQMAESIGICWCDDDETDDEAWKQNSRN